MAGVAGRSGGHNKLSAAQHRLRGTFRRSRHGQPTADAFDVLSELRDRHLARYRRLAARADELEAGSDSPDIGRLLRALRAEAQLVAALTIQRTRFAEEPPEADVDDPFAEFDAQAWADNAAARHQQNLTGGR